MNFKIGSLSAASLALAVLFAPLSAHASSIVVNGDFTAGPYDGGGAGWTVSLNSYSYPMWNFVYFGDHADPSISDAVSGCSGSGCTDMSGPYPAYISQLLPTVAGDSYTLSFLYSPGSGSPNELQALFGNMVAEDILNLGTNTFALYTVSGLVATSSSTNLEFLGRADSGGIALTEVNVQDDGPAPVPEPPILYLLGAGLVGLTALYRHKRMA